MIYKNTSRYQGSRTTRSLSVPFERYLSKDFGWDLDDLCFSPYPSIHKNRSNGILKSRVDLNSWYGVRRIVIYRPYVIHELYTNYLLTHLHI